MFSPKPLFLGLALMTSLSAAVKIEKTSYAGWPNCYRLTNGEVELIVTTDIGPRVMRYGFVGGQNLFAEFKAQLGKKGEKEWQARGGHRIWFAPEHPQLTYALDNNTIKATVKADSIELAQPVEPEMGLEKTIIVKLAATGSAVEITHRIKNTAQKLREFAPWALTMMAPGGMGFTGFPPRGTHPKDLLPTNPLVMWAYTDLSDPRWKFTKKYMMLRMDPKATSPQKLATFNRDTWGAYLLGSDLYIKRYAADPAKHYPDMGVSFETFTNNEFLELETVGPLRSVKVGEVAEHIERWTLHKNIKISSWTDAEIDKVVLPLLK